MFSDNVMAASRCTACTAAINAAFWVASAPGGCLPTAVGMAYFSMYTAQNFSPFLRNHTGQYSQ